MILNGVSACLLLAILVPLGYGITQWLFWVHPNPFDHPVWHEPLDDWNR
jgi:hypothetical protein